MRRIAKRDLARGWVGWVEPYLEAKRRERMLKQAGARLTKPKVIASFARWRKDWEAEQHDKETMSITQLYHREIKQHKEAIAKITQLTKQLDDARQAMAEGRGQEAELQRRRGTAEENVKRIEHTKEMALKRVMCDLARGWTTWHMGWSEQRRQENLLGGCLRQRRSSWQLQRRHKDWRLRSAKGDERRNAPRQGWKQTAT